MSFFVLRLTARSRFAVVISSTAEIMLNAVCRTFPPFNAIRYMYRLSCSDSCSRTLRRVFLPSSIASHSRSNSIASFSKASRSMQSSNRSGPLSPTMRKFDTTKACIDCSRSFTLPRCLLHSFFARAKAFQIRYAATVALEGSYERRIRTISKCRSCITSLGSIASGSDHIRKIFVAIFSNSFDVISTNFA